MNSQRFLKEVWYAVALTEELKKPQDLAARKILGEPLVLFRDESGKAVALRDICPHRGIPLSYGRIVQGQIECPYHGWKFCGAGNCTDIPSLVPGQKLDPTKIKVQSLQTLEQQGVIWAYFGEKKLEGPQVPWLQALDEKARPQVVLQATMNCHIDHAVIGLMDPAHGPYVHKSPLWRSEKTAYVKQKKFKPIPFGFQMVRHKPSSNSKAYKILGSSPTTEISFQLPGVRVEHIEIGRKNLYSFTLLTPSDEGRTLIFELLYWDIGWLNWVRPLVKKFAQYFLNQDIRAVNQQQEGLRYNPNLMLIPDADTQARWYFQLKQNWLEFIDEGKPFENPVSEVVLQWRS